MNVFSSVLVFSILSSLSSAYAGLNCGKPLASDLKSIVEKVVIVGPSDERMQFKDFAKSIGVDEDEVKKMFSGTGIIKCDNKGASAQITQSQSVITTAGHLFFDKDCNPQRFSKCQIHMFRKNDFEVFDLDLSSLKTGTCDQMAKTNDWAVIRSKSPIPKRYRAYTVDTEGGELKAEEKITQVVAYAKNFLINSTYPPHVANCSSKGRNVNGLVTFDCDTGAGSSGAAIFRRSKLGSQMTAIGVAESGVNKINGATQIEGDFLKAILDASRN